MNQMSVLALLALLSLLPAVQGQTARPAELLKYDAAQEVTLRGTVSNVLASPAPGMIGGSHLLLATPSGPVDASLGRFGLLGKGALSAVAGEQIEATGVMKTIRGRQVFLTRAVKAGGEVYIIRTKSGLAISPQTRERLAEKAAGGTL